MYSSIRIADEFLKIAKERGCKDMTPMKLIKLVYLAHGMSLAHCGEPLIRDSIEAWRYGPVIPTLYGQVSAYGGSPVKDVSAGGNLDEITEKYYKDLYLPTESTEGETSYA